MKVTFILFLLYFLMSILIGCAGPAAPGGGLATEESAYEESAYKVKTWVGLRDEYAIKQRFDYSCGAASLATLLHYYYGDDIGETEILKDIIAHLDKEAVKNRTQIGFSMLDLKNFVERRGYRAIGVKLKATAVPKLRGPILVYLEIAEFKHFAMLRGVREDRVYLADPSRGNVRMSIYKFLDEWPGYALVVQKPGVKLPEEYPGMISEESPIRQEFNAVRQALGRAQSTDYNYSNFGF